MAPAGLYGAACRDQPVPVKLARMETAHRNCLHCGNPFVPRRSDHYFDREKCAEDFRQDRPGPLPGKQAPIPPADLALFIEGMRRAKPPKSAIGYKLYCAPLLVWLPLPHTQRWNGRFPKEDYFRLRPVEIPRVPLAASYRLAWVYPGNNVVEVAHELYVCFPADMKRSGEVGRRLRAHIASQRQLPPNTEQLLLGENEKGQPGSDRDPADDS